MADELYVLNKGVSLSQSNTTAPFKNHNTNTSVNPRLFSTNVTNTNTVTLNCYEIHDAVRTTRAAATVGSSLLNRLFPVNTTVESYINNLGESPGYEVIIETDSDDNGSSDLTMNLTNADYFVVVYADNLYKHHIGKITSYDVYEGTKYKINFTPKLKENIPYGTKLAIYQGPASSVTTTVAVGYGLLSDGYAVGTSQKEERHDVYADVTKPTFYFYKDLEHNKKYVAIKTTTGVGTTSKSVFKTAHRLVRYLTDGDSNIDLNYPIYEDKSFYKQNIKLYDQRVMGDELITLAVGATGQNTKKKPPSYTGTGASYTFDITDWDNSIKNYDDRQGDIPTYIQEITSPNKNQYMGHAYGTVLNSSITNVGNMAKAKFIDNQRMMERKINNFERFKVKELIATEKIERKPNALLPGKYTRASSSTITVSDLEISQDIRLLLGSSAPFEYLYIGDYYYIPSAISANSAGEQTITVTAQRLFTAFAFSSASIPVFTSQNAYRNIWSSVTNNFIVNHEIDTNIDGSDIKRNGTVLINNEADINGLEYMFIGKDINGFSVNVDKGDKINNYTELISNPTSSYYSSVKLLDSIKSDIIVNNTRFEGKIELIETESSAGSFTTVITGRDSISELLGYPINKNYIYSNEWVQSTISPFTNNYTSIGSWQTKSTNSMNSSTLTRVTGSTTMALKRGDVLVLYLGSSSRILNESSDIDFDDRFIPLGVVSQDYATSHSGNIVLMNDALINTGHLGLQNETSSYGVYKQNKHLLAGKSLTNSYRGNDRHTDLYGAADKGIVFYGKGQTLEHTDSNSVTLTSLLQDEDEDSNYGMDINNILVIDGNGGARTDSPIGFDFTHDIINSLSSHEIVDKIPFSASASESDTEITIGYVSPIVLGKTDTNTSDTMISNLEGIYLVNKNGLDKGGFLHLLDSRNNTNYSAGSFRRMLSEDRLLNDSAQKVYNYFLHFGSSIYRYNGLGMGNIRYTSNKQDIVSGTKRDSAYMNNFYGDKRGLFNSYAFGTKVAIKRTFSSSYFRGRSQDYLREDAICLRGPQPAWGSKFQDYNKYPYQWHTNSNNYSIRFPKFNSGVPGSGGTNARDIDNSRNGEKLLWDLHDPKTGNLHLFAPGDMLPTSEKRFDDIFSGSHDAEDYHLLVKYKPSTTSLGLNHEKYIGDILVDNDTDKTYEIVPIQALTKDDPRRFNLLKMKQMTLDWLFNEVDFETYKLDNYGDKSIYWHKDRGEKIDHYSKIYVPQTIPDSGYGITPTTITSAIPSDGANTVINGNSLILSGKECYTSPYSDSTGQSRIIGIAPTSVIVTKASQCDWTGGNNYIDMDSTSSLSVGMLVSKKGSTVITQPTTITEITSGTRITLSATIPGTSTVSNDTLVFMPQRVSFSSFNTGVVGYTGEIYIKNSDSYTTNHLDDDDYSIFQSTSSQPGLGDNQLLGVASSSSDYTGEHNYNAMFVDVTNEVQPTYRNTYGRNSQPMILLGSHYLHGIDIVVDSSASDKAIITIYTGNTMYGSIDNTNQLNQLWDNIAVAADTIVVSGLSGANGTYTIDDYTVSRASNYSLIIACSAVSGTTNGTYNLTTSSHKLTFDTIARASHCTFHRSLHDSNATKTNTSEISHGTASGTWHSGAYNGMDIVVMDSIKAQDNPRAMALQQEYKKATGFGVELNETSRVHNTEVYPFFKIDTDLSNDLGDGNEACKRVLWDCLFAPKLDMNALLGSGPGNVHRHALSSSIADEGIISININLIRDNNNPLDANGDNIYFSSVNGEDFSYKSTAEWIHYAPDLTGRFLVNESTGKFHQILSHSISKLGDLHQSKHQLHVDNYDNFSATATYNVYTLSDNCMTENRTSYPLYNPSITNLIDPKTNEYHTGYGIDPNDLTIELDHSTSASLSDVINQMNGTTAQTASSVFAYKEGKVKAMYVIAELDGKGSKYLIHRDNSILFPAATATGKFEVGSLNNVLLTDGIDKVNTTMEVIENPNGASSSLTTLQFNNTADLKGSVSIGTTFRVRVPKLKGNGIVESVKIVQPFNVLNESEDIVNDILEDNNIVYTKSGSENKYYVGANFTGENAYTSINNILEYKNMKLDIKGETIKIADNEEAKNFRSVEINEDNNDIQIVSISKDKSLLDRFNEIIIYGDNVRGIARNNKDIQIRGKSYTKEVFDYSISSQKEIDIKARNMLKIHNELNQAIQIEVASELPLLESGHIINTFYPSEGIERQPFAIIEIIREMGMPTKLLLSQYSKDLTGTLSLLLSTTSQLQGLSKDKVYANVTIPNINLQSLRLKFVKATITASIAATGTTESTIGFGSTIGFEGRIIT